ncbi:MAG: transposase [Eubacterium sp.]|nr:transposase [Eubacterium sp.]
MQEPGVKRIRIEKYFDKLAEARKWLSEAKYEDLHGDISSFADMTVDAWFNYWISEIKTKTVVGVHLAAIKTAIIRILPENEFHAEEIKEIYHLRWGIETSFCTLKHTIAAVNFHAKSRQMITHEIWARLILFNFCSYIKGQVTFEKQKRKHIHQVDFSIAFKTCRHFLRLHSGEKPPDVEGLITN